MAGPFPPMVEVREPARARASRPGEMMGFVTTAGLTKPASAQAVSRLAARGSHLDHRMMPPITGPPYPPMVEGLETR